MPSPKSIKKRLRGFVEQAAEDLSSPFRLAGALAGFNVDDAMDAGGDVLRLLSRPAGATVGALAGENPAESARGAIRGFADPESGLRRGRDVGFVRHLPDEDVVGALSPRDIGGGVASAVLDPLNLVGVGGISLARKGGTAAKTAARASRAIPVEEVPHFVEPTLTAIDTLAQRQDPLTHLMARIKDAKPLQQQNKELLSKFRSQQAEAFTGALKSGEGGETGMKSAIGAMRGSAERVTFEPIRDYIGQVGVDDLANRIAASGIQPFEKVNAFEALTNILDGEVPTPSSLAKLDSVFPGVTDALKKANIFPKDPWFQKAVDIANLPRAVMASGDLSATLRQSAMAAPSHPRAWLRAMADQVAAYRSQAGAEGAMERINSHPLRSFLDDMKVDILPIDGNAPFTAREEAFMSKIANNLPLVERSQRAYTTALNSMRAGMAYDILNGMSPEKLAAMTPDSLEKIGRMVNAFTGRGTIPRSAQQYQSLLNAAFFSPRNNIGRVQAHLSLLSNEPIVRKEAAKSLVAFYATGSGILASARIAGLRVGMTPGSSDFGKIELPGGTRLDIWGGNAQLFRLIYNFLTGETVNVEGDVTERNQGATIMRFLRTKLAPGPGLVVNQLVGRDVIGRETRTPTAYARQALESLTPLFLQDLAEAAVAAGPAEGAAAGTASFFGVGAQSQEPTTTGGLAPGRLPRAPVLPRQQLPKLKLATPPRAR